MRVAIWRSRLVGRGRTIGNRVTGNTVREFESLLLRQIKMPPFGWRFYLLDKRADRTLSLLRRKMDGICDGKYDMA